eukprot:1321543-Prymnesium_polylepis.1
MHVMWPGHDQDGNASRAHPSHQLIGEAQREALIQDTPTKVPEVCVALAIFHEENRLPHFLLDEQEDDAEACHRMPQRYVSEMALARCH